MLFIKAILLEFAAAVCLMASIQCMTIFFIQLMKASMTALVVTDFCMLSVWLALTYDLVWHAGLNYLGNSSLVHAQSIIATLAVQVHFSIQTHEST